MNKGCINCFKVITARQRFRIFNFLKKKKKATVNSLVKLTALKQPTVTFHINQLVKKDFVHKIKIGRHVYCEIHKKCRHCPLFS